jgi:hypothetical protein
VEEERHETSGEDGVAHVDVVVGPEALKEREGSNVEVRVQELLGGGRVGDHKLLRDGGSVLAEKVHRGDVHAGGGESHGGKLGRGVRWRREGGSDGGRLK